MASIIPKVILPITDSFLKSSYSDPLHDVLIKQTLGPEISQIVATYAFGYFFLNIEELFFIEIKPKISSVEILSKHNACDLFCDIHNTERLASLLTNENMIAGFNYGRKRLKLALQNRIYLSIISSKLFKKIEPEELVLHSLQLLHKITHEFDKTKRLTDRLVDLAHLDITLNSKIRHPVHVITSHPYPDVAALLIQFIFNKNLLNNSLSIFCNLVSKKRCEKKINDLYQNISKFDLEFNTKLMFSDMFVPEKIESPKTKIDVEVKKVPSKKVTKERKYVTISPKITDLVDKTDIFYKHDSSKRFLEEKKEFSDDKLQEAIDEWTIEDERRIVKALLEKGADPNYQDEKGYTPLQKCKDVIVADLLLQYGAKINQLDLQLNSVLHYAVSNNNLLFIKKIISEYPKLINQQNYAGRTPLHVAILTASISVSHFEIAHLLIDSGSCKTHLFDYKSFTALQYAKKYLEECTIIHQKALLKIKKREIIEINAKKAAMEAIADKLQPFDPMPVKTLSSADENCLIALCSKIKACFTCCCFC